MKLPTNRIDDIGRVDYTAIGQADADLASAAMALESALDRADLTPAQRRDFNAARRWVRRASRAIGRHVDLDLDSLGDDAALARGQENEPNGGG